MSREYVQERNGTYFVAGSRVTLDSIIHHFQQGMSPESILNHSTP